MSILPSVAQKTIQAVIRHFAHYEEQIRSEGAWSGVREYLDGTRDTRKPYLFDELTAHETEAVIMLTAVHHLWQRCRVAYDIHEDMADELSMSTSSKLDGATFLSIPYTNPFFAYREPTITTHYSGERSWLIGFYAYGLQRHTGNTWTITAASDPDNVRIGLLLVCTVLGKDGTTWGDFIPVNFPVDNEFTIDSIIQEASESYTINHEVVRTNRDQIRTWMSTVLPSAITYLLYMCTHEPLDVVPVPTKKAAKKPGKPVPHKDKPIRRITVGYRLGPVLKKIATKAKEARRSGTRTGDEQDPHQRRGHFKRQHYGARVLNLRKAIFVLPYMVRLDKLADYGLDIRILTPPGKMTRKPLSHKKK